MNLNVDNEFLISQNTPVDLRGPNGNIIRTMDDVHVSYLLKDNWCTTFVLLCLSCTYS